MIILSLKRKLMSGGTCIIIMIFFSYNYFEWETIKSFNKRKILIKKEKVGSAC